MDVYSDNDNNENIIQKEENKTDLIGENFFLEFQRKENRKEIL